MSHSVFELKYNCGGRRPRPDRRRRLPMIEKRELGRFALRFQWFCKGTDSRRRQIFQTRQVGLKPYIQLIYLQNSDQGSECQTVDH